MTTHPRPSADSGAIVATDRVCTGETADEELIRRISGGDEVALGELYDRHAALLLSIAIAILQDPAEARDVVHDAFVTVADRAAQYVPERGTVRAWLVGLARNLSIDRTRRLALRGRVARQLLASGPFALLDTPESIAAGATERLLLRRALASLPEVQRLTLEVAFFEGLSYSQIAERENVPLGTVKSRAARALTSLRKALEGERS
jgi:RNA polymerase sigma-70 factor (ECF subfamily)